MAAEYNIAAWNCGNGSRVLISVVPKLAWLMLYRLLRLRLRLPVYAASNR